MTVTLYAQPYDISARGFFFESLERYQNEAASKTNTYGIPVEEFEVQFIDGDAIDAQLFLIWEVGQSEIGAFLKAVEAWDDHAKTKAIIALREGMTEFDPTNDDPEELDIDIYHLDSLVDLAWEFVEEGLFGDIPERLQFYIDYSAIARDLAMDYTTIMIGEARLIYRAG